MATVAAVSNGPVSFFTQQGTQLTVPISSLEFSNGNLQLRSSYTGPNPPGLSAWLLFLANAGVILPGVAPPRPEAIVFTAAHPGATGNDVKVELTYSTPPTSYTVKATQVDVYNGLTAATVTAVLGSASQAGSRPGLVQVRTSSFTTPIDLPAQNLADGDDAPATAASATCTFGAGESLVLEASAAGDDGNKITIAITQSDATAKTFTLTATWTDSVSVDATALAASQITTINDALGYVLQASQPTSGLTPPQAGVFNLSGGADVSPALKASAVVLSNT